MVGIVGGALMSCAISRKVSAMMLPAFMASKVGNYIIFCDKHKNLIVNEISSINVMCILFQGKQEQQGARQGRGKRRKHEEEYY